MILHDFFWILGVDLEAEGGVGVTEADFGDKGMLAEGGEDFGLAVRKGGAIRAQILKSKGSELIRHIFPPPSVFDDIL